MNAHIHTHTHTHSHTHTHTHPHTWVQEPELQHLLVESRVIESQYSHYFDWVIVNDDLSVSPASLASSIILNLSLFP